MSTPTDPPPTLVLLEPPTPFDTCIAWRLHDAYWSQRGPAAWQSGEVPFYSTSNLATARQHAALLVALVADLQHAEHLGPDSEVWVLEAGCGLGLFAANLLAALETGSEDQRALLPRVRYLLTDCSETNLRQVLELPRVAPWRDRGHLVPALYDLRHPLTLTRLDGQPTPPLTLIVCNYVCSVIPQQQLQRRDGLWHELLVETRAATGLSADTFLAQATCDATRQNLLTDLDLQMSWRPLELESHPLFTEAHRKVLARFTEGLPSATFGYPARYFDFLVQAQALLIPDGAIITSDYGGATRERVRGLRDRRPQTYGNSLAQETCFATFDALTAELGWDVCRSHGNLDSVHTAIVAPRLGPCLRAAFADQFRGILVVDELLDHTASARHFAALKDFPRALRYWLRAAAMDELNPELRYRIGECAIEAGEYALAITHLLAGHALDPQTFDFDFMLGRATWLADQADEAIRWYEHSLAREPHPVTWTNLGVIHFAQKREAHAWACFESAIALDPEYPRALEHLTALRELAWQRQTSAWRETLEAKPD
ncbi:MAG TPA: SAM-dependent methyltransferase [Myxococcota bacterium]|nr:SAM-dependent methyltransferase [Myxococcota bacterium]